MSPFRRFPIPVPIGARLALVAAVAALAAPGCADKPSKDEQEAAKNTFACTLSGERVVLYQIPTASGVRFSNGSMELRGKGVDLQLFTDVAVTPRVDCQPYVLPKPA